MPLVTVADYQGLICKMVPLDGILGDVEHLWLVNYGLGHRLPTLFYYTLVSSVQWGLSRLIDGIWSGGRLTGEESDRVRSYLSAIKDDSYKMLDRLSTSSSYPLLGKMTRTSILPNVVPADWWWPTDPSSPYYMGDVRYRVWPMMGGPYYGQ